MYYFFFSSRRRHTRFDCDWSSDVCSSDLCASQLDWVYGTLRPGPDRHAPRRDRRAEKRKMRQETPWSLVKHPSEDRKSTRLNSSHSQISYAVFCLKKKKNRCRKD